MLTDILIDCYFIYFEIIFRIVSFQVVNILMIKLVWLKQQLHCQGNIDLSSKIVLYSLLYND